MGRGVAVNVLPSLPAFRLPTQSDTRTGNCLVLVIRLSLVFSRNQSDANCAWAGGRLSRCGVLPHQFPTSPQRRRWR